MGRHLPLILVAVMALFVAVAVVQGCGDSSTDKHKAACQKVCSCDVTSLDSNTCTNLCLNDTGNSFNSFFGAQMSTACYDCYAAKSCADINNGACTTACP